MSHTLASDPPIARIRTARPDLRRDAAIATLKTAGEEDFAKRLREFDRVRWSTACRHMQIRIINGHYEAAHDVLRAFVRVVNKVPATLHSHVSSVLPVRTANALEDAGYATMAAVARATDEQLLRDCDNFGQHMLSETRRAQAAVMAGRLHETSTDDEELLDDDVLVQSLPAVPCNCRSHAMSESDRLIEALQMLTEKPDELVAAIDSKIAEIEKTIGGHELQIARLTRLRKTLQPKPRAGAKKDKPTIDEIEQRVHAYVAANGPAKCAAIAAELSLGFVQIGQAVSRSTRLAKDDQGRVTVAA